MTERASAGHKLGQLVGDWFEEYYVLPLLTQAAQELRLFLDNRFIERSARGDRILWKDIDGNEADYDFVLELGGTNNETGIPVGFVESFWRRGARHSKDKARDDSGKLMPMRDTYPTARFLGIVAAGAFTPFPGSPHLWWGMNERAVGPPGEARMECQANRFPQGQNPGEATTFGGG
jgi:hypothetical protein